MKPKKSKPSPLHKRWRRSKYHVPWHMMWGCDPRNRFRRRRAPTLDELDNWSR